MLARPIDTIVLIAKHEKKKNTIVGYIRSATNEILNTLISGILIITKIGSLPAT